MSNTEDYLERAERLAEEIQLSGTASDHTEYLASCVRLLCKAVRELSAKDDA